MRIWGVMNSHPWNKSFVWQNHTATSGELTQTQIDQFDNDGYVIVNDVFTSDELKELVEITDAAQAEAAAFLAAQPNERIAISEIGAITFAAQIASRKPEIRKFVKKHKNNGGVPRSCWPRRADVPRSSGLQAD